MNQLKLTNVRIKLIHPTQQVTEKFSKREFVVTDGLDSDYPQHIMLQATRDKCSLLDQFKVNDMVDVAINIRGREWTSPQGEIKYFNSIEAWRIEPSSGQAPSAAPSGMSDFGISSPSSTQSPLESAAEESDDLPF
jgi:hypothetical protein